MTHIQPPHFTGRARRGGRRAASPPDMTSMVGLGFLLVSFFLMAADFSKPTIMQLAMPMKPETRDTLSCVFRCGPALTILLDANNELHYYEGLPNGLTKQDIHKTDFGASGLRQVLLRAKKDHGTVVLIKPTDQASYQNMVDVLDEMNITDTKRYALVDLTEEGQKLLDQQHASQQH